MAPASYVIVTPVRNEEANLPATVVSVTSQTVRPSLWVLVDDGSTDGTPKVIEHARSQHGWIRSVTRPDRGFRKQGGGVVEAFYEGYRLVENEAWDFLVKLDGDLSFPANYFEGCFERFARDPRLGIGGGRVYHQINGAAVEDSPGDPAFHVRGATKIYRRAAWAAIGRLVPAPGWDTIDELKANMLGWRTYSFRELRICQLKPTGSADGSWKNWGKNGRANYITGYHPLFMLLKCFKRAFESPHGVAAGGLLVGFLAGYLKRLPQVPDPNLIRYLRRQQLNRLFGRESLWTPDH